MTCISRALFSRHGGARTQLATPMTWKRIDRCSPWSPLHRKNNKYAIKLNCSSRRPGKVGVVMINSFISIVYLVRRLKVFPLEFSVSGTTHIDQ